MTGTEEKLQGHFHLHRRTDARLLAPTHRPDHSEKRDPAEQTRLLQRLRPGEGLTSESLPFAFLTPGSSAPALSVSAVLPQWTSASAAAACCVFLSAPRRDQDSLGKT